MSKRISQDQAREMAVELCRVRSEPPDYLKVRKYQAMFKLHYDVQEVISQREASNEHKRQG